MRNNYVKERMEALEREINAEALQHEMMRKTKEYSNMYRGYLKSGEITDALKVGNDKDGGYLVPDEMEKGIVEALEENNVIRKVANVVTTEQLLKLTETTKGPQGIWVEEGGELAFSDMEFCQVIIDAHKNAVMIRVTDEMLEDLGVDIEKYIIKTAGKSVGELEEEAFVTGDGVHKPRGVILDAEVGTSVNELNADALIGLYSSLRQRYRKNAVWIMNDEAESTLRKFKSYGGRPIWEPDITKKTPGKLLGYPIYVTKSMPRPLPGNISVAFGDFSYYWIGDRGKRSIKRLNEVYAENGMVGYRVTHRVDGRLTVAEAVKTLKIAA